MGTYSTIAFYPLHDYFLQLCCRVLVMVNNPSILFKLKKKLYVGSVHAEDMHTYILCIITLISTSCSCGYIQHAEAVTEISPSSATDQSGLSGFGGYRCLILSNPLWSGIIIKLIPVGCIINISYLLKANIYFKLYIGVKQICLSLGLSLNDGNCGEGHITTCL